MPWRGPEVPGEFLTADDLASLERMAQRARANPRIARLLDERVELERAVRALRRRVAEITAEDET